MIEYIQPPPTPDGDEGLLAIIIGDSYKFGGVRFVTPPELSQQVAHISHPAGHKIKPHVHCQVERKVRFTQEFLYVKRGKVRLDLYLNDRSYFCSRTLESGDSVLLVGGGHGFEVLEDCILLECKNGPFLNPITDKVRFEGRT
jgi:hypothetical protein